MVPVRAEDNVTMKPKRRKLRLKKQAAIALAVFGVGLAIIASGAKRDIDNNEVRNRLLDESTKVTCHITSVETKEQTMFMDDNVVSSTQYGLLGTYDHDGEKCVVALSDLHSDKATAEKYVNTDMDVYINNDRLGVAGATTVQIPPADTSSRKYFVFGGIGMAAGLVILFFPHKKKKITKTRAFANA
jgi:hypothetical protein